MFCCGKANAKNDGRVGKDFVSELGNGDDDDNGGDQ
jgi:hypothetical protein